MTENSRVLRKFLALVPSCNVLGPEIYLLCHSEKRSDEESAFVFRF